MTLSRAFPEHGLSDVVHFDYAIYALGSHLPARRPSRAESVAWLQQHQQAVAAAGSVLVVGGGALGIRECSRAVP